MFTISSPGRTPRTRISTGTSCKARRKLISTDSELRPSMVRRSLPILFAANRTASTILASSSLPACPPVTPNTATVSVPSTTSPSLLRFCAGLGKFAPTGTKITFWSLGGIQESFSWWDSEY